MHWLALRLAAGGALLSTLAWAVPADACNCPKEYLIKKYGTVSQMPQPAPPPPPVAAPDDGG